MATISLFRPIHFSVFSPLSQASTPFASTSTSSSTTSVRNSKPTVAPLVSTTETAASLPKKKVLVPVGLGTEEMEAVILVSVLRRAGANVLMASVEKLLEIEGSSGTKLVADVFVTACTNEIFDLVALPGGMPGSARLRDCEILQKITSRQAEGKRLFGAICAAPAVVLEPWGLMRRKKMTCHPAFMHKLSTFRAVKSNIQVSGELTTSRGPGTAYEFALSFVQQLFGDSHAEEVRGEVLVQNEMGPIQKEFNSNDWSLSHIPGVLIPIANGSEEMEVVAVVDILRRAKIDVLVASVEKTVQIVASQKTKIIADTLIAAAADSIFDLIILPGGLTGSTRLQKSKVLKNLLKDQKSAGRIFGAIGSSAAILEKQGLLTNKIVAYHPSTIEKVNCQVADGAGVIIDGKLITSKGLVTVIDFSLAIVNKLFGHARARSVAEGLVYEYPRS